MTGRTKGRLAVVALVGLVVAAGFVLATSRPGRVHYWACRMHSDDRATRESARHRLMEIGRPAIDRVLPDLIAGAARDSVGERDCRGLLVFVCPDPEPLDRMQTTLVCTVETTLLGHVERGDEIRLDPPWDLRADAADMMGGHARWLVVAWPGFNMGIFATADGLCVTPLPDEENLARAIVEETRARLALPR